VTDFVVGHRIQVKPETLEKDAKHEVLKSNKKK